MSRKGLFQTKTKASAFSKRVDAKMGKGFCMAVKAKTVTPVLGAQALGEFAKSAIKSARFQGLNGPMRTDRKYDYSKKCDIYIELFGKMVESITDAEALNNLKYKTLYSQIDAGMYAAIPYTVFIDQIKNMFLMLPNVTDMHIDRFLRNHDVRKELEALWVA